MPDEHAYFEANRAMWDERVPIHVGSRFYDVDGFRAGRECLRPFELTEVGDVAGKTLVHLQCHFGLDTLSWARHGARVAGLDFSEPAVAMARQLATEIGVAAEFVTATVYDAVAAFGGRQFDVVYTGLGALVWLPDMTRWAKVVAALQKPGGILYLSEFHPFTDVFSYRTLEVVRPYFDSGPQVDDESGTYTDSAVTTKNNLSYQWIHPIGEVVTALVEAGLHLEFLHEHDYTLWARWPFLERRSIDEYRLPEGMPSLPLMYSLRARKPA